jgi:hypothetical protein
MRQNKNVFFGVVESKKTQLRQITVIREIGKVTLFSPYLWASSQLLAPLLVVSVR